MLTFLKRVILIINYRPLTHVYVNPFDFEAFTPNHILRQGFKKSTVLRTMYVRDKLLVQEPRLTFFGKDGSTTVLKTMQYYGYAKVEPPKVRDLVTMVDKNYHRNTRPSTKFKKCTLVEIGKSELVYVKPLQGG